MKPKIGRILKADKEYTRDAIHVPIIPVTCDAYVSAGFSVRVEGSKAILDSHSTMGVVDPFLRDVVVPGEKFYVFLKPESTLNLWHDWTHAAIDKKPLKKEA